MNIWNFTGNIGKNCEIKCLPSGEAICTFSVAVSSGYGDKKKTTWANCAIFGKQASGTLPSYLTQGTQVAVSGEVTLEEWAGQDGVKHKALKVRVINVDLIGGKNEKPQSVRVVTDFGSGHSESGLSRAPIAQPPAGFDSFDEDIPF